MPQQRRKKATSKARDGQQEGAVDNQLVKALSHPLRARALSILNERVASPKELSRELGFPVGNVSYHVKTLEKLGCIEQVKTAQRRGAVEHYYRGITRSFFNDTNWAQLSPDAKNGISVAALKMINDAAKAALLAETLDSHPDRHLSCTPVVIDEQGWGDIVALLEGTLNRVIEIQAQSAGRLAEEETRGLRATVSILSFESPFGDGEAAP